MNHRGTKKQRLENEINDKIDYNDAVSITFSGDFTFYMVLVPQFMILSPGAGDVKLDNDMLQDLQQARVVNWCRTADRLYPVHTKSDGNCLCHAVSMAIWGLPDEKLTLRNLILVSINSTSKKERWQRNYQNTGANGRDSMMLSLNEWDREWKHVVDTASTTRTTSSVTPYAHLEAIHIFTLANILKRPIIVVADLTARTLAGTSLQESDIGGLYLPLERPAKMCHKYPIVLGYTMSHFCPLLPQENPEKSTFKVPIVTRDGSSLPIRFLNAGEEKQASVLLKSYLKVTEVPLSSSDTLDLVLCAEVKGLPLPHTLRVFPEAFQANTPFLQQTIEPAAVAANFQAVPCVTPGCTFYGSPATGNMCSGCLDKYLKQTRPNPQPHGYQNQVQQAFANVEPTAPFPSMPPSENFVDLSIMGEQCMTGCGLRCSTKTYPYCHECVEKTRNTSSHGQSSTQDISRVQVPTGGPTGFASLGEMVTSGSSFGSGLAGLAVGGTSQNNIAPGFGASEQTFVQVGSGQIRTGGATVNTTQTIGTAALFGTGTTEGVKVINPGTQLCRGDECTLQGKSHLGGLCDRCYMKEERKKKICSTPGCLGDRGETDLCNQCQGRTVPETAPMKVDKKEREGLPDKQLESGGLPHSTSSSLIASGAECNAETMNLPMNEGPEDKINCASPMCNSQIYPPDKLCPNCIEILRRNQAEQNHHSPNLQPTTVSLREETASWPPSGRSNSTPIAVHSQHMNVQLAEAARSNSAPIGRKCVTPGCTKFGDPSMADMCTACYQMSHAGYVGTSSMAAAAPPENSFSAMMERVASQKRSPKHCKAANCFNYGNQNNEGFCNSCYPRYLSMVKNKLR